MALDQRLQQQTMMLNQQKLEATGQLRQRAVQMTAQAEQTRLQREMAEQAMQQRGALGGYPQMGYGMYGQAPMVTRQ